MDIFEIKNLNFTFPRAASPSLRNVNLKIAEGEFVLIVGQSGSGKTTLLSHLKPAMTPFGSCTGEILYKNQPISRLSLRQRAAEIGYVPQDPDSRIVTPSVWSEMAFGCENLGIEAGEMRRRIAETANFFGIDKWFHRQVSTLSGGQKQLLNLACTMVLQPRVLLLDEPCASLDPVAAREFLNAVYRVNSELGTTVIMAEHRTGGIFPLADKILYMENGSLTDCKSPKEAAKLDCLQEYLPAPAKVALLLGERENIPLDIKSGRRWLENYTKNFENKTYKKDAPRLPGQTALEMKDVYFRYDKKGEDILKGCSLSLPRGSICAVIGGNGSGKTTLLKVIAGISRHYSGKIVKNGRRVYLPQEAKLLFSKETVYEELREMTRDKDLIASAVKTCKIENLLSRHPYDISAGQGQRAALAKILLTGAEILLLDEITRGLDPYFKNQLAEILKALCRQSKTVIMVSHDIEFCAAHRDIVGMFFDGGIIDRANPRDFFSKNNFYTTQGARMSRDILQGCVCREDIVDLCRRNKTKI